MTPPTFSLGEVEAMARKAARGAGLSWGMAEEAGWAARWLCAAGLDGCAALATALAALELSDPAARAPAGLGSPWRAPSGELCALHAGALLSDAATFWAEEGVEMEAVAAPLLLLPFAAGAARCLRRPVALRWPETEALTDGTALELRGPPPAPAAAASRLRVAVAGPAGRIATSCRRRTRAAPDGDDWAFLEALAARTYAPATEASRLKGAGAGLSDND